MPEPVCPTMAIVSPGWAVKLMPFNTSLKLQECSSCGEPIAPEVLLSRLALKLGAIAEVVSLCPECKAAERARALADVAKRGTVGEIVGAE